jgi:hypothetical protein
MWQIVLVKRESVLPVANAALFLVLAHQLDGDLFADHWFAFNQENSPFHNPFLRLWSRPAPCQVYIHVRFHVSLSGQKLLVSMVSICATSIVVLGSPFGAGFLAVMTDHDRFAKAEREKNQETEEGARGSKAVRQWNCQHWAQSRACPAKANEMPTG